MGRLEVFTGGLFYKGWLKLVFPDGRFELFDQQMRYRISVS